MRALIAALVLLPALARAEPLASVVIEGVPHVEQEPDFCGEACVAMWLGKLGVPGDQDWVFEEARLDPELGRGVWSSELARALGRIGFHIGDGWSHVRAGDQAALAVQFRALHADLLRGVPSIVCMWYQRGPGSTQHFRLILGYDAATDEVIYQEPAQADAAYRRMARPEFLALWQLPTDKDGERLLVRFRLDGHPAGGTRAAIPGAAERAQHVLAFHEVRARWPRAPRWLANALASAQAPVRAPAR